MTLFQTIGAASVLVLASACGANEDTSSNDGERQAPEQSDAKFTAVLKGGPAFDQSAKNFRVREATADFYWVVSDDYTVRIDARFQDGDGQLMATDLGNRNTMITYSDPEHGELLCGKDWSEDVIGDLQRTSLTAERVEATFRIELDKCTKPNDELVPGKMAILSGSFSLPRTGG